MTKALDVQIGGEHYKKLKIQPMEYSMANNLDACQHTAIEYITRFRDKGGITDLQKAKHCIDMLIDFERSRLADLATDFVVDATVGGGEFSETLAKQFSTITSGSFEQGPMEFAQEEKPKADPFGPRDADGWYTWNGDDTMRPAGEVKYVMRDGGKGGDIAESLNWKHGKNPDDIVKWRPAQEQAK